MDEKTVTTVIDSIESVIVGKEVGDILDALTYILANIAVATAKKPQHEVTADAIIMDIIVMLITAKEHIVSTVAPEGATIN